MSILFKILTTIQQTLLPALEIELAAPLGDKGELFVRVIELARPGRFIESFEWHGVGCPRKWRLPILHAFLAKAVWNFPTTRALLDRLAHDPTLRRLCGWEKAADVPGESTFSRAFAEFAKGRLSEALHEGLVRQGLEGKLMGHASLDATAIVGREKPAPKPAADTAGKRKRGRPRKGEAPELPEPKRLALQPSRTAARNLAELPTACDVGCKRDAKGYKTTWIGYKHHIVTVDGDIPVAAVLSSASLHDSQAAIPLMQVAAGRVQYLYDLQDAAYDAAAIRDFSRAQGHVPIIAPNARGSKALPPPLEPARAARFKERSAAERVNSDLKENHGGNSVRVRGDVKVLAHLTLGLLVLTVKGLCRLLT